jgi:D-alanyl-D-alanine carboxypeptidase-like protein
MENGKKPDWEDPSEAPTPVDRPMRPLPIPLTHEERVRIFGHFDFTPYPLPGDPEHIRIKQPWEFDHLVTVQLPFSGSGATHARVHKLIAKQFSDLFEAWRQAGLLKQILTFDGAFYARYKRGRAGGGEDALSNHSWGTAFDLNAPWNRMGTRGADLGRQGSTRQLIPLALKFGFLNGVQFADPYCDAMHFEAFQVMP